MNKRMLILQVIILFMFVVFVAAEDVVDIINKINKAIGGLDKIKAAHTAIIEGKFYQGAMEMSMIIKVKKPDHVRVEITIQGQTLIQAYDGERAWQIVPFLGTTDAESIPEEEAKNLKMQADLDGPFVDYKEKGINIELIGEEELEGNNVYKLKVIREGGDVYYYYIDKESYIPLKHSHIMKKGDSEINVENFYSDYKSVDGILIPFTYESKVSGQAAGSFVITEIKFNADIDDSIFKMPEKEPIKEKKDTDKKQN